MDSDGAPKADDTTSTVNIIVDFVAEDFDDDELHLDPHLYQELGHDQAHTKSSMALRKSLAKSHLDDESLNKMRHLALVEEGSAGSCCEEDNEEPNTQNKRQGSLQQKDQDACGPATNSIVSLPFLAGGEQYLPDAIKAIATAGRHLLQSFQLYILEEENCGAFMDSNDFTSNDVDGDLNTNSEEYRVRRLAQLEKELRECKEERARLLPEDQRKKSDAETRKTWQEEGKRLSSAGRSSADEGRRDSQNKSGADNEGRPRRLSMEEEDKIEEEKRQHRLSLKKNKTENAERPIRMSVEETQQLYENKKARRPSQEPESNQESGERPRRLSQEPESNKEGGERARRLSQEGEDRAPQLSEKPVSNKEGGERARRLSQEVESNKEGEERARRLLPEPESNKEGGERARRLSQEAESNKEGRERARRLSQEGEDRAPQLSEKPVTNKEGGERARRLSQEAENKSTERENDRRQDRENKSENKERDGRQDTENKSENKERERRQDTENKSENKERERRQDTENKSENKERERRQDSDNKSENKERDRRQDTENKGEKKERERRLSQEAENKSAERENERRQDRENKSVNKERERRQETENKSENKERERRQDTENKPGNKESERRNEAESKSENKERERRQAAENKSENKERERQQDTENKSKNKERERRLSQETEYKYENEEGESHLSEEVENKSEKKERERRLSQEPENKSKKKERERRLSQEPENKSEIKERERRLSQEPENKSEKKERERRLSQEPENKSEKKERERRLSQEPENKSENKERERRLSQEAENKYENEERESQLTEELENKSEKKERERRPSQEPENNTAQRENERRQGRETKSENKERERGQDIENKSKTKERERRLSQETEDKYENEEGESHLSEEVENKSEKKERERRLSQEAENKSENEERESQLSEVENKSENKERDRRNVTENKSGNKERERRPEAENKSGKKERERRPEAENKSGNKERERQQEAENKSKNKERERRQEAENKSENKEMERRQDTENKGETKKRKCRPKAGNKSKNKEREHRQDTENKSENKEKDPRRRLEMHQELDKKLREGRKSLDFVDYFFKENGFTYISVLKQIKVDFEQRALAILSTAPEDVQSNAKRFQTRVDVLKTITPVEKEKEIEEYNYPVVINKDCSYFKIEAKEKLEQIKKYHKYILKMVLQWKYLMKEKKDLQLLTVYETAKELLAGTMILCYPIFVLIANFIGELCENPLQNKEQYSPKYLFEHLHKMADSISDEIGAVEESCCLILEADGLTQGRKEADDLIGKLRTQSLQAKNSLCWAMKSVGSVLFHFNLLILLKDTDGDLNSNSDEYRASRAKLEKQLRECKEEKARLRHEEERKQLARLREEEERKKLARLREEEERKKLARLRHEKERKKLAQLEKELQECKEEKARILPEEERKKSDGRSSADEGRRDNQNRSGEDNEGRLSMEEDPMDEEKRQHRISLENIKTGNEERPIRISGEEAQLYENKKARRPSQEAESKDREEKTRPLSQVKDGNNERVDKSRRRSQEPESNKDREEKTRPLSQVEDGNNERIDKSRRRSQEPESNKEQEERPRRRSQKGESNKEGGERARRLFVVISQEPENKSENKEEERRLSQGAENKTAKKEIERRQDTENKSETKKRERLPDTENKIENKERERRQDAENKIENKERERRQDTEHKSENKERERRQDTEHKNENKEKDPRRRLEMHQELDKKLREDRKSLDFVDYFFKKDGFTYIGVLTQIKLDFEQRALASLSTAPEDVQRNAKRFKTKVDVLKKITPVEKEKEIEEYNYPVVINKDCSYFKIEAKEKLEHITKYHKYILKMVLHWKYLMKEKKDLQLLTVYETATELLAGTMVLCYPIFVRIANFIGELCENPLQNKEQYSPKYLIEHLHKMVDSISDEIGAVEESCCLILEADGLTLGRKDANDLIGKLRTQSLHAKNSLCWAMKSVGSVLFHFNLLILLAEMGHQPPTRQEHLQIAVNNTEPKKDDGKEKKDTRKAQNQMARFGDSGGTKSKDFVDAFCQKDGFQYVITLTEMRTKYQDQCKVELQNASIPVLENADSFAESVYQIRRVATNDHERILAEYDFPTFFASECSEFDLDIADRLEAIRKFHKGLVKFIGDMNVKLKIDADSLYDLTVQSLASVMVLVYPFFIKLGSFLGKLADKPTPSNATRFNPDKITHRLRRIVDITVDEEGAIGDAFLQLVDRIFGQDMEVAKKMKIRISAQIKLGKNCASWAVKSISPVLFYYYIRLICAQEKAGRLQLRKP